MISSYPKIWNLGHRAIVDLFQDPVVVEEKVDGSQFSFFKDEDGDVHFRSKNKDLDTNAPDTLFKKGVDEILSIKDKLIAGYTYRGEYLSKPKHNTLAYDRVPEHNVVIFDIERGMQDFCEPREKRALAKRAGLETVPAIAFRSYQNWEELKEELDRESFLGGQKVEGLVIKNYSRFDEHTGHCLMGKYVSEKFREIHGGDWKQRNPNKKDVIESIIEKLRTPARWEKAVQHLKDAGFLEGSPRDIGLLIKEVPADVDAECFQEIHDALYKWAWPQISRGIVRGLPEWYKERLAEEAFGHSNDSGSVEVSEEPI